MGYHFLAFQSGSLCHECGDLRPSKIVPLDFLVLLQWNIFLFRVSEGIFAVNGSILASTLARQMDTFKRVHLLCFGMGSVVP